MPTIALIEAKPGALTYWLNDELHVLPAQQSNRYKRMVMNTYFGETLVGTFVLIKFPPAGTPVLDYVWLKNAFLLPDYRAGNSLGGRLQIRQRWFAWIDKWFPNIPLLTNEIFCQEYHLQGAFTNLHFARKCMEFNDSRGLPATYPGPNWKESFTNGRLRPQN